MPYPSLTFAQTLEQATRQELEQFISLLQGYLSVQHKEDGTHSNISADSVTVNTPANGASIGQVIGNLVPSVTGTYTLGGQETATPLAQFAWLALYLTGTIYWGDFTSLISNHAAAWADAVASGGNRTTTASQATTQTWEFLNSIGVSLATIGGPTTVGLSSGSGVTIPRLQTTTFEAVSGVIERGRQARMGEWASVAFNAGSFVASGAQTWTLTSPDQTTFAYSLVGKTMTVMFSLDTTSVGGTPDTELRIGVPGGFTIAQTTVNPIRVLDNGAASVGHALVVAGQTVIRCFNDMTGTTNWAASVNNTYLQGQIAFEVQ